MGGGVRPNTKRMTTNNRALHIDTRCTREKNKTANTRMNTHETWELGKTSTASELMNMLKFGRRDSATPTNWHLQSDAAVCNIIMPGVRPFKTRE